MQILSPKRRHVSPKWFGKIKCFPGKVVVVMDDPPEQVGNLYLPDEHTEGGSFKESLRNDRGVVISSGCDGINEGDFVWVSPMAGKWFQGFWAKDEYIDAQVRMYGIWNDIGAECAPIDNFIIMVQTKDTIRPNGEYILILRDEPRTTTESGIVLPNSKHERTHAAKVLIKGDLCKYVETGDRVIYQAGGLEPCEIQNDPELEQILIKQYGLTKDDFHNLALIREEFLYCTI